MSAAFFVEWTDDDGEHKEVYRDFGSALAKFSMVYLGDSTEDAALRFCS
jgi:hypothetical protein